MQQKDVIYIDVEDDITAIIGKVKDAKEKIVALVPPKRVGVLQSSVNLRLLARTADEADKRLVIITGNAALAGLAASAKIPVAKTLQSRPEIAEIPALSVDDEDVIDGGQLPVGEHAGLKDADADKTLPVSITDLDIDGEVATAKPPAGKSASQPAKKRGIKVPDFGSFRKKLALGVSAGVLLVAFLVWAIWFAPHATVVVSARTSDVEVSTPLTIGDDLQVDSEKKTLPSITQSETKSDSVEFSATGQKEVGEKASGTVVFSNCQTVSPNSATIAAGTFISANGNNYIVQQTVVVPGGTGNFITGCTSPGQSSPVNVLAEAIGGEYNIAANTEFAVAGYSDQMVATSSGGVSGGSKKTVKVVSAEDVQKAREQLAEADEQAMKEELADNFDDGVTVIDDSFKVTIGEQTVTPGIGEEASGGKATLGVDVTYSIVGVARTALEEYLDKAVSELIDEERQRIYETGAESAALSDYQAGTDKKTAAVQLLATGKVGPKIEDDEIKELVKGKRYGEIAADLKAIEGVSDVDVNLSPFWVQGVPGDVNKITIEFKLVGND